MHGLPGAPGQRADLFECYALNQIGADAIKRNRGAQAALIERPAIGHPDQQPAGNFRCHFPAYLLRIARLAKEGLCFGAHHWMFHGAGAYTQLPFHNRISVQVMR